MNTAVRSIATGTLKEALRSRLLLLLAVLALAAVGLAGFLQAVVPAEGRATNTALLAALLRLAGAGIVATFAVTAIVREHADKQVEMLLALPYPRATWLLGRLAGCALLALLPAGVAGLLVAMAAPPAQAALWTVALLGELWIVAAFAVFCTLTLQHALPSLCATAGFYVLARSVTALQQAGHGALPDAGQRVIGTGTDLLAFVLPRLDAFARSDWLLYGTGTAADLGFVALQSLVYVALLAGAALFDLYRKEF
ncbi:ABC transporter permease [Pseudoduganella sp. SL102]|uniref:ABC transporter permease subunit n=1 Tax=Pseudoduganella sp. SL102 TaxID=2995154 RepID=UPI00248AD65F|nr:ABC transporter permease [Pseudoduganella sp. SL102]WBR99808.1 ABC transporter permease [Pseudoduganella sp. SL102]